MTKFSNTKKTLSIAAMLIIGLFAFCRLAVAQTQVGTTYHQGVYYTLWSDGTASIEDDYYHHNNLYGTLNLLDTITYWDVKYALKRIGDNAFSFGHLTGSLTIPAIVTSIGDNAFRECEFNGTLTLPDSLTSIGASAFYQCQFTGPLTLPGGLTSIGSSAFYACPFTGSLTLPPSLTVIGPLAFDHCLFAGDLVIPDGVTTIGYNAFFYNQLTSVTIGDNVTTIGARAFWGTIDNIVLGRSVSSIGDEAFLYTGDVSNHTLHIECRSAVPPTLGTEVFEYSFFPMGSISVPCGATEAYIQAEGWPSTNYTYVVQSNVCINGVYYKLDCETGTAMVTHSGYTEDNTNNDSYSGEVEIPATVTYSNTVYNVTRIGNYAFRACDSLSIVTIGDNVESIGYYAFKYCTYLTSAVLGGNLQTIDYNAFEDCSSLANVSFGSQVRIIGASAFYGCHSLASVVLGNNVEEIKPSAFEDCTSLEDVVLGRGLEYLGSSAFMNCSSISSITCYRATPPSAHSSTFSGVPATAMLYVPCGAESSYANNTYWSRFDGYIQSERLNVQVGDFYYDLPCDGTTATVIHDAFYATMQYATIPDTIAYEGTKYAVTAIADGAFQGCDSLLSAYLPETITAIGTNAFRNCSNLVGLNIPAGVTHLSDGLLEGCCSLYGVNLSPTTPPMVGTNVFAGLSDNAVMFVPFCYQYEYSQAAPFNTFEITGDGMCEYNFWGTTDSSWTNLENWFGPDYQNCTQLPGPDARVSIKDGGICEIVDDLTIGSITIGDYYWEDEDDIYMDKLNVKNGATLTATDFIYTVGDTKHLVIEDGAQLIHPNAGVKATVRKTIAGYGDEKDNYYLIGYPFAENGLVADMNSFLENDYDLYYYDEPTHYWMNQELSANNFIELEAARGYLYANSQTQTIGLTGTLRTATETVNLPLSYTEAAGNLKGFNLVGNPFAHKVTSFAGANVADEVYRLNDLKNDLVVSSIDADNPLHPAEGFFVKATGDNATITYNDNSGAKGSERSLSLSEGATIVMNLTQDGLLIDRFILKRDGAPLEKLTLSENGTKVFAVRHNQEMAVVPIEGNEQTVSFKAAKNGTYTLSVNAENMEFDYLHLIDNLTGADVDLHRHETLIAGEDPFREGGTLIAGEDPQSTPSYTFTAKTTDYANRFRLVFASGVAGEAACEPPFAYISNGNIVITTDIGDATLQIVDVMGRVVVSKDVSGNVSTNGMPTGVYVLRLVGGDTVRTQKIVVGF